MMKAVIACAAAALLASGAHTAPAPVPFGEEARIPFAHRGGIRDFEVASDRTLYLEGRGGRWYRATLFGPCLGLRFARGIGIDTGGSSGLDRFGSIIVDGERCKLESLVRSAPPPNERKTQRS